MRPTSAGGNLLVGNTSFSSRDGSIAIDGGPAQGQVDFSTGTRSVVSPEFDLTVPGNTVEIFPEMPGYFPVLCQIQAVITAIAGTMTTPPSSKAGSNPAHDNWLSPNASIPINAAAFSAGLFGYGSTTSLLGNGKVAQEMTTPTVLELTVPASGPAGIVCRVRIMTRVTLLPIP